MAELRWDPSVPPNEIGVVVKDGVVTLTGTVDTYMKKWRAETAYEFSSMVSSLVDYEQSMSDIAELRRKLTSE